MTKVYIVTKTREVEYEFSDTSIEGVFWNLIAAQKFKVKCERDEPDAPSGENIYFELGEKEVNEE